LRVEDGRLDFGTFQATSDLPILAPDLLPPPTGTEGDELRWARYGGTGHWANLNLTPDFPSAARAMAQHWRTVGGLTVDGIIVADPFALQGLLELTGPADVSSLDVTLDAETVVPFVTNEAYSRFESETERKEVLGAVAAATLQRFLDGGQDASRDLIAKMGELLSGGHLLAYSTDPDIQAAFRRTDIAGQLGGPGNGSPGDLINVVINSGSASKVDYYASRTIDLTTTLLAEGAARTELTVTLTNDAPTEGQPRYIIGPNNPRLDAGDSLSNLSVYLARSARFTDVPPRLDGPSFTESELGHPVHDGWVRIPGSGSVERSYRWVTEDAWRDEGEGELRYDVLLRGQTVMRPTEVRYELRIPDGYEVIERPEGSEVDDGSIAWSKTIGGEDVRLRFGLRPARNR
jgi:hypothetical protein